LVAKAEPGLRFAGEGDILNVESRAFEHHMFPEFCISEVAISKPSIGWMGAISLMAPP